MDSDGTACRILIQDEQLEQLDMFLYLGSLTTKDGECTTEFRTRLNHVKQRARDRASLQKNMEKSQHTDINEDLTTVI